MKEDDSICGNHEIRIEGLSSWCFRAGLPQVFLPWFLSACPTDSSLLWIQIRSSWCNVCNRYVIPCAAEESQVILNQCTQHLGTWWRESWPRWAERVTAAWSSWAGNGATSSQTICWSAVSRYNLDSGAEGRWVCRVGVQAGQKQGIRESWERRHWQWVCVFEPQWLQVRAAELMGGCGCRSGCAEVEIFTAGAHTVTHLQNIYI